MKEAAARDRVRLMTLSFAHQSSPTQWERKGPVAQQRGGEGACNGDGERVEASPSPNLSPKGERRMKEAAAGGQTA